MGIVCPTITKDSIGRAAIITHLKSRPLVEYLKRYSMRGIYCRVLDVCGTPLQDYKLVKYPMADLITPGGTIYEHTGCAWFEYVQDEDDIELLHYWEAEQRYSDSTALYLNKFPNRTLGNTL